MNKKIAIVWWGLNGLFLAYELLKKWFTNITLYEKGGTLWWLLWYYDFSWVKLEKYYHHIFNTDKDLIQLIKELWLQHDLIFKESTIGNLNHNNIVPFVTPMDLLKYPYLNFREKIRVWFFSLFLQKYPYGEQFTKISVKKRIIRYMGKWSWEKLRKPLFKKKFHQYTDTLSLSFLWTRLYVRANSKKWSKEMLWYMKWSFYNIIEKVISFLYNKIIIKTNSSIEYIDEHIVVVNWKRYMYDMIISTLATPIFSTLINKDKYNDFYNKLVSVKYLSIICPLFVLKNKVTNYYWINNIDEAIDIWWIIEHTNLFDFYEYAGKKFMYFSHYLTHASPLFQQDESYLKNYYMQIFQEVFPWSIKPLDIFISKDAFAQPVYTVNFNDDLIKFETPMVDVYQCNMVNFLPIERGINSSIMVAKKFTKFLIENEKNN